MRNGIRVESVTKRFAGLLALDDVSLTVGADEIVGLIGPNGSGKSTLVNVITGIFAPDEGTISLDDRDITGADSSVVARAGIARTFQTVRLFSNPSVRDNVTAVVRHPARLDDVVDGWLDRLGISHLADTTAGRLSFGLQRRVEIARALATEPSYLLLDEPAAGLNDAESAELEGILAALPTDPAIRCGVLVIDHDMRLIHSLCHRIHVLGNGRTIAMGPPRKCEATRWWLRPTWVGGEPDGVRSGSPSLIGHPDMPTRRAALVR